MSSASPAAFTSSAAPAGQVSLCVAVQPAQSSVQRGQAALWTVTAWATGGDVPDATIKLTAAPASLTPAFSFGCGSADGSASCDLGAVDANAAKRQLQAKVTVPASATTVTSVRVTAVGSAANLPKDPQASAATTVTAAPAASGSSGSSASSAGSGSPAGPGAPGAPGTNVSPLTVGNLPYLSTASPELSPGGNAAALFPSLSPSKDPGAGTAGGQKANGRPVANSSPLPLSAPVLGAQLAGLAVLALAFVLAVTKLSIRRRPKPADGPSSAGGLPAQQPPGPPPAGAPEA